MKFLAFAVAFAVAVGVMVGDAGCVAPPPPGVEEGFQCPNNQMTGDSVKDAALNAKCGWEDGANECGLCFQCVLDPSSPTIQLCDDLWRTYVTNVNLCAANAPAGSDTETLCCNDVIQAKTHWIDPIPHLWKNYVKAFKCPAAGSGANVDDALDSSNSSEGAQRRSHSLGKLKDRIHIGVEVNVE